MLKSIISKSKRLSVVSKISFWSIKSEFSSSNESDNDLFTYLNSLNFPTDFQYNTNHSCLFLFYDDCDKSCQPFVSHLCWVILADKSFFQNYKLCVSKQLTCFMIFNKIRCSVLKKIVLEVALHHHDYFNLRYFHYLSFLCLKNYIIRLYNPELRTKLIQKVLWFFKLVTTILCLSSVNLLIRNLQ